MFQQLTLTTDFYLKEVFAVVVFIFCLFVLMKLISLQN